MIIIKRETNPFVIHYYLVALAWSAIDVSSTNDPFPTLAPSEVPVSSAESQDWNVLRTSLIVYLPSFAGIILLFCYVRLKFPAVYNVRNKVESLKNPLAATSHGYFSWMWKVVQIKESEIFRTCGMDALCLIRITRMGSYLSLVSVFCSIFLIPVYESDASVDIADEFVSSTAASLPEGSRSFTASVVAAYIIFGSTLLLMLKEFRWFIVQRETFLSMTEARSYTVYVSGIPPCYRSDAALAQFFRRVIADDVVHFASVAIHIPKLSAAVNRQAQLQNNLERMKTIRDLHHGKEPMHFVLGPKRGEIVERVPAIPYFTHQLYNVREEIEELKGRVARRQMDMDSCQPESSLSISLPIFQGKSSVQCESSKGLVVSAASIVCGAYTGPDTNICEFDENRDTSIPPIPESDESNKDDTSLEIGKECFSRVRIQTDTSFSSHQFDANTQKGSSADVAVTEISTNRNEDGRPVDAGLTALEIPSHHVSIQTDTLFSSHHFDGDNQEEKSDGVPSIDAHNGSDEGRPLDAGFVMLKKLSSVAVALQTVHSTVPFQMDVFEAPSPDQILWKNVGLPHSVLQPRRLVAAVLTTLLCIFWTVPVTFLVSLTEVQVLKDKIPFLEDWLVAVPWLEQLLNQLSPLLLSLLNSVVVPIILRLLSTLEGVLGLSHQEASLFFKLAMFYLIQTFLVASLAGGVTSALVAVNDVRNVFKYLAKTLPPQSVYFMQLILIQTVIGLGTELLRTTALFQAAFRSRIGPRVTENDRREPFLGLRPLCNPRYFLHAQCLAGTTLRFMVLFTFSVLSPFVCYVLLFSFIAMEVGYRHQFIYVYPPTLDSGGQLWMQFIKILLVCMVVIEIVLMAFMALSAATDQVYSMIPLLFSTATFFVYLRQRHFNVAQYLCLETCDKVDSVNNFNRSSSDVFPFNHLKYVQPELLLANRSLTLE